ncbi:P-loop containing nucleoside triphosphate hydrolase protein [Armillaria mellea]|nr:P-loop containing nucleoside triphosphate hydrolase protein [Armillaria mellea]
MVRKAEVAESQPEFGSGTGSSDSNLLDTIYLGVYRMFVEKKAFRTLDFNLDRFISLRNRRLSSYRNIKRMLLDVFPITPFLILSSLAITIWVRGLQRVVLVGLENRILQIIEQGLATHSIDSEAIIYAVIARMACAASSGAPLVMDIRAVIHTRIMNYYDDLILTAKLRMDLPMIQDNHSFEHLSSSVPFDALDEMISLVAILSGCVSQLGLIIVVARFADHGLMFALVCLIKPAFQLFGQLSIFTTPRVVEAFNRNFLRMHALKGLTDKMYRLDIISGNIVQYIITEYRRAQVALGDTSYESAEMQYLSNSSSWSLPVFTALLGDLPVVFYATLAVLRPSQLSLAAIATVQASSRMLQGTFGAIKYDIQKLERYSSQIQQIYDVQSMAEVIKDGHLPYPNEKESEKGMSFELRKVSFSYPGSKPGVKALDDVSFKIEAGDMVVVVGANGSGKSTFVNVLTRLYDATSGQVLIDGENIKEFRIAGLRKAIATLTQDHHLYPLSIKENIGLGNVDAVEDFGYDYGSCEERRSGATIQYGALVNEGSDTPLVSQLKKLKKTMDISGGERQRLAASRTFMRFNSNEIKFVAVDEPTSALDPEGEQTLFNNLRAAREGKTMLFITHRFGPLTRHADKIICMKEGKMVESGDHSQLMQLKGEYFKMYNIQAKAFQPIADSIESDERKILSVG